ncbi:MAG: hypothetical protein JWM47_1738 [Acidimicrobiales bacterium]|nr:hypothetical protein [Acidimicrobiales bacterium]
MTATTLRDTGALRRKAQVLVWATIAWNVIEAVVALTAGTAAVVAAVAAREGLEAWKGELLEEGGCC